MLIRRRYSTALIAIIFATTVLRTFAQLKVAPELPLTLDGNLALGYIHSARTLSDLDSVNVGINATLEGYYHHPNFFQFQVSPHYNFGKEVSEADFITGGRGLAASANIFGGSTFPLFINYSRMRSSTGQYRIIGYEAGLLGEGANEDLSMNWSLKVPRLPVIQVGYQRTASEYTVTGANNSFSEGHGSGYSLGIQYLLKGFALTASYTSQDLKQLLPDLFTGLATVPTATVQRNLQFSASRNLSSSTFLDLTASKSEWSSDATGYATDRNYTTIGGGISARPFRRLGTSARVTHISDLAAASLVSVLTGTRPAGVTPAQLAVPTWGEVSLGYTTYSGTADYDIGHGLLFRANARRGSGTLAGRVGTSDFIASSALSYSRPIFGGRIGATYAFGVSDFRYANRSGGLSRGHSGSFYLTKPTRIGWEAGASAHFSQSDMEGILSATMMRGYGAQLNTTGRIHGDWRLTAEARFDKSEAITASYYSNRQQLLRATLMRPHLNLSVSQQFSSGISIITATGLRPVPVANAAAIGSSLDRILLPTGASVTSVSGSYSASRRFLLNGMWMKLKYRTDLSSGYAESLTDQVEALATYHTRLLTFRLGYRRYFQTLPHAVSSFGAQTVFFDVSREFHVF